MCEPADFIFDEQGGESSKALSHWDSFYNGLPSDYRVRIARRPIHDDDKRLMPLQAGDLLAWFIRRHLYDIEKVEQLGGHQIGPYMEWDGIGFT